MKEFDFMHCRSFCQIEGNSAIDLF